MTTAYIVDLDPVTERYHRSTNASRRQLSIRDNGSGTMAGQGADCSVGIPIISEVFNKMLEVVKKDGPRGLTFSMTPNYHEFNDSYGLPWFNHYFLQEFIPSQPEIKARLESGIRMLDVGCGRGAAMKMLAQSFPNSHFVGLDIDQCNVDWAYKDVATLGLKNLEYVCADASAMPNDWTSTFDYVFFFNLLHDTPRPDLIIDDVKRVMKKDGIMSVIELYAESKHADNLGDPNASFIYTDSLFYCLPMSNNHPGSMALGAMWGKDSIKKFLEGKGFKVKAVSTLPMMPQLHFLSELM
ncbi:sterol 24-C-methyltransferase [Strongylocentrotus purpuratus]|uniref:Methyltransferase domain-containing protein n=1 Tax=Strongylocentrotus purpuratus TaxID=7668 RepID=A0A7M7RHV3_STRPU|nr:sterol 24-C-methyltransferase [Strongylocentrotus purpuratus]